MRAYRLAFRNRCLQCLNQPAKKQSMAFAGAEASALPGPCSLLRVLSHRAARAQLMRSSLLRCSDLPVRRRLSNRLGCACGSSERCNCSQLSVHPCLVWGCRKDGEPPLLAVIHHLGINCSSVLCPPAQGLRQLGQLGAGSASPLLGAHLRSLQWGLPEPINQSPGPSNLLGFQLKLFLTNLSQCQPG